MMRYGSVCSGIEAASVAWEPLGWQPAWFSEIDAFPSAVLAHRFPAVPNLGDMTTIHEKEEFQRDAIDLLVGGTPCQSFSVAGLRGGLEDPRGNLALIFLRIASIARPRWIVWENVPGVLSSNGGRDFGSFLGALAELGYGWAYRVLDAQYFGVPQRRRRVFVVGHLGDGARAARVLFEPESVRGYPSQGRGPQVQVAACPTTGTGKRYDAETETLIAFHATQDPISGPVSPALGTSMYAGVLHQGVRRLTPRECERLQGFPDDWTLVPYRGKPAANGPRYKACGNSMAVPVMRWIGSRIAEAEAES
jgi:DNA (cytosine-5)-methyltransferase 1